jgi:hypothetical protein
LSRGLLQSLSGDTGKNLIGAMIFFRCSLRLLQASLVSVQGAKSLAKSDAFS